MSGRPFTFKSPEELQKKINAYWEYCEENERPRTYTGLAYYLGVTRQTLFNYNKRDKFTPILDRAKARIEMDLDERLQTMGNSTAGIIFSLKNNYGWTDKTEINSYNTTESTNTNRNYNFNHLSTQQIKELLDDE